MDIHPLDRAIAELRSELARSPDNPTLLGRLGALHYRRGNLKEAESCYRQALGFLPDRSSLHNNLGNVLCDLGRVREGIACYEQALALERAAGPRRSPSPEAETNLELARLEYRLVHERVEYLEQTAQLGVSTAEHHNALGGAYLLRNERTKALAEIRRAAQSDPRNVYAVRNLGFAHALDLTGRGDRGAARAELAEGAVRFPHDARIFLHQAELFEAEGDFERAERSYRRALHADPRGLEAYDLLGRLQTVLGDASGPDSAAAEVEAALEALAESVRAAPPGSASAALDQARIELAEAKFYREPLADTTALAGLLREAARRAEALPAEADAVTEPAAVLHAQLLEAARRRPDAAQVLDAACARRPGSGRLWFERGGLAFRSGDPKRAVECFEKAVLAEPQEAYLYHALRFAFEGYRRYRTECVRFDAASRLNPRDALAHHHLGLAELAVMKDADAEGHFRKALEYDPRLAVAACGLGRALQKQGRLDEARAAFARALEIDPACAEAQRALQSFHLSDQLAAPPAR